MNRRSDALSSFGLIAIVILVLLVVVAVLYLLISKPAVTEVIMNIAIILLAVQSLVIGALLIVLLLEIRNLARLLQGEVKPLLDSVNETAATVKGTTAFLSNNVAMPLIRVASFAAGVRRAAQILRRSGEAEREA